MSALLAMVPRWVWAALVAALAATSCKLTVDLGAVKLELEKARVAMAEQEASYEAARANAAEVLAESQAKARETEQAISTRVAAIKEETHAQVRASTAAADDLRRRLRNAQAEARTLATAALVPGAAAVAATPEVAIGSDRPLVLGTLGEADVDEADRAEVIRIELLGCYRQYDAARAEIEAMSARP